MGVGLVRPLQPPDILCIHWRVYNPFADTSKGVLFLPPLMFVSEALSPPYFNTTLLHKSSERSSLISGPSFNSSPPEAKKPGVFAWFSNNFTGRSLGVGSGNPLQYTCLEKSHEQRSLWATVRETAESQATKHILVEHGQCDHSTKLFLLFQASEHVWCDENCMRIHGHNKVTKYFML